MDNGWLQEAKTPESEYMMKVSRESNKCYRPNIRREDILIEYSQLSL